MVYDANPPFQGFSSLHLMSLLIMSHPKCMIFLAPCIPMARQHAWTTFCVRKEKPFIFTCPFCYTSSGRFFYKSKGQLSIFMFLEPHLNVCPLLSLETFCPFDVWFLTLPSFPLGSETCLCWIILQIILSFWFSILHFISLFLGLSYCSSLVWFPQGVCMVPFRISVYSVLGRSFSSWFQMSFIC